MTLYIPARQSDSVIDVSHWQRKPNWVKVKDGNPGLRGVIAKATQGTGHDPSWGWNAQHLGPVGFLVGAYHFMTADDAQDQVDNFLGTVAPTPGVLIALDWETNPGRETADLETVEEMVTLIEQQLGRLPVMYLGRSQISAPSAVLNRCDLWLPEYGKRPLCPPGWTKWRLHQHTDGTLGDVTTQIAGIGRCDRSYYDETRGPIEEWWGQPPKAAALSA